MSKKHQRLYLALFNNWSKQIENWTIRQIKDKNWCYSTSEEFEDLLQDARILFWKIEKTYSSITNPAHLFSLYKTSFTRLMIDKVRKRNRSKLDTVSLENFFEDELPESNLQNYGHLAMLVNELPSELKSVLSALTSTEVKVKVKPPRRPHQRENHNMRLKRMLNLMSEDPVNNLKNYFLT